VSSLALYVLGFAGLIVGLAMAAYLLGAPSAAIVVGAVLLAGYGILAVIARAWRAPPPGR